MPVILCTVPGEMWKVSPGDISKMTDQLIRVLRDDELFARLRRNTLVKAPDYDGQKCVDRMEAKYEELMRAAGR